MQLCVERILGAHGMINYVDARTAWMDDIVKQAQWQGITQVGSLTTHERAFMATSSIRVPTLHHMWLCKATLAAGHRARAKASVLKSHRWHRVMLG